MTLQYIYIYIIHNETWIEELKKYIYLKFRNFKMSKGLLEF